MKISDKLPPQTLIGTQTNSPQPKGGGDFAQTLAQAEAAALPEGSALATGQAALGLEKMSPAGRIFTINPSGPAVQVEKTLALLDRYAQALNDPTQSLKQISSLVKDLEDQAAALTGISKELPSGHGLKGLLDQTAVLATVEAAKFNRGDYV